MTGVQTCALPILFIEKGVDLSVCVVEKGAEVGMFLISWFPHPKIQMV